MRQVLENDRLVLAAASLAETAGVVATLVVFHVLFAALGFQIAVFELLHRTLFLVLAALASTWTLRRAGGISLRDMAVTAALVAACLIALVLADPAGGTAPTHPAAFAVVPLVAAVALLARWRVDWWTGTHTSLLLIVAGAAVVFAAAPPVVDPVPEEPLGLSLSVDVSLIADDLGSRVTVTRDGLTSGLDASLAAAGGLLYVVGRITS